MQGSKLVALRCLALAKKWNGEMSRSAAFRVLIRDGQQRRYAEVWASLRRELIWGADEFEAWLVAGGEADWEPEDISAVAVVDFDTKVLAWGEVDSLSSGRSNALYGQLLQHAWAGFSISEIPGEGLERVFCELIDVPFDSDDEEEWDERPEDVQTAASYLLPGMSRDEDEEEDEEEDDYEDEPPFSEENPGAWVTIIERTGAVSQRGLIELSEDVLSGKQSVLAALTDLEPVELPAEKFVVEGLLIDQQQQRIVYWGTGGEKLVGKLHDGWAGWSVESLLDGYLQQCQASGLAGVPMNDAEVLGGFVPGLLSNKRFRLANLLGAMGVSLKNSAITATGCLTMVLALPILLVALFTGLWKESGYALLTLVAIVVMGFKVIEAKLKSQVQGAFSESEVELEELRPPVAGPIDEAPRWERMDQMLNACQLPRLAEIEPYFDETEQLLLGMGE